MKDNTKQSGADFSEEGVPSVSQVLDQNCATKRELDVISFEKPGTPPMGLDGSFLGPDEEKRLGMDKLSRPAKWKKLAWYSMRVERAGTEDMVLGKRQESNDKC
ncbi:hypothetical protein ACOSQ3_014490 [Xanthoceras sorbifolium]